MKFLTVVGLLVAALAASSEAKGRVVCYFGSWAVYRQGEGHFDVANVDLKLCSHFIYSFAKVSWEGEIQVYDDYNDVGDEWHTGQFSKLAALRPTSPSTKIMIAVGGWNHGPGPFQAVVVDQGKRQRFVDTSVDFCKKYGFDGLDIDWEYQDAIGGTPEQLSGFNELLRMLRQRYNQEGLLLSAATSANFHLIDVNYDWRVMSETLDFINLMAYDLRGAWEKTTGHHGALHPDGVEQGDERNLNAEAVTRKYIEKGADPAKINIGIPLYGRGFTLADPNNSGMHAPTTGPSQMGNLVPEAGILGYDEICLNRWPETQTVQGPYAVRGDQWVGYDSVESIKTKMDFMRSLGVTNYMVWSVETDDFNGKCNMGGSFPLLRSINSNA